MTIETTRVIPISVIEAEDILMHALHTEDAFHVTLDGELVHVTPSCSLYFVQHQTLYELVGISEFHEFVIHSICDDYDGELSFCAGAPYCFYRVTKGEGLCISPKDFCLLIESFSS